jgi:uncharacterized protein DUF4784
LAAECQTSNPVWNAMIKWSGGAGDAVVPLWSANALPFGFTPKPFVGGDEDALHWRLNRSAAVFNEVEGEMASLESASRATTDTTIVVEGTGAPGLTAEAETHLHTIQLEDSTYTSFTLFYPSGNLDLRLTAPSGQVFDAVTVVGNPDVTRAEDVFLNGRMELFAFTRPEIGSWSVEVLAPDVPDSIPTMPYVLNTLLRNPALTVEADVSASQIGIGEPFTLYTRLKRSGASILGATVNGDVFRPDSTIDTLTLRDNGVFPDSSASDGVYTARYLATSLPGSYEVGITASRAGVLGQPDFQRRASTVSTAHAPRSGFQGTFGDHGLDSNGNGKFDSLLVDVNLDIVDANRYRVVGILRDSAGHVQEAASEANLAPGLRTMTLVFDGSVIFDNHTDGPYTVSDLGLAEVHGNVRITDEWFSGSYQTAAYPFSSFENLKRVLYITGTFAYDDSLAGPNKTFLLGRIVAYDTKDRCAGCDSTALDSLAASEIPDDGTGSGRFTIGPILNRDMNDDSGLLDIVVRVYYQTDFGFPGLGWTLTLVDSTGSRWHYDYPLHRDVDVDTLLLGELKPTDYANRAALHLCRTLDERAWDGVFESSDPITGITVVWSPGYSRFPGQKGTSYDPVAQTLYVDGRRDSSTYSPDEWDDLVVLRGFAHHVARNIKVLAAGQSAYSTCPVSVPDSLAWNEGFALFYASYIQTVRGRDSNYVDVGVDPSGATNRFTINLENGCTTPACPSGCFNESGSGNELAVAGALWDLYDAHNDNPNGDAFGDSVTVNGGSIVAYIAQARPFIRRIQEFEDYFVHATTDPKVDYRKYLLRRMVFYEHGIFSASGVEDSDLSPPAVLTLYPSRPNPFNPTTRITFGIPGSIRVPVRLAIYDVRGALVRRLVDAPYPPGIHQVIWDGRSAIGSEVASGVYFCKLDTPAGNRRIKMVLAR